MCTDVPPFNLCYHRVLYRFRTVRAKFLYVKLNKDGQDGKEVFNVLIEDDSDKTNVVAFGDQAKKLRSALLGHEVITFIDIFLPL